MQQQHTTAAALTTPSLPSHPSLRHTTLFIKCPFEFAKYPYNRQLISVQVHTTHAACQRPPPAHASLSACTNRYNRTRVSVQFGDGDGIEISSYQYLEGCLPVKMPKLYYADISRQSSYYLLITECVPYANRGKTEDGYKLDWRDFDVGEVLPKSGKYQDDRIVDAHLYYYALLRAMARIAAADKRGKLDKALSQFPGGGVMKGPTGGTVIDNKTRRQMLADRAKSMFDDTIMFAW